LQILRTAGDEPDMVQMLADRGHAAAAKQVEGYGRLLREF